MNEKISTDLIHLAVPIDSLQFHPKNTRDHRKRDSIESIKSSYSLFGQQKPIKVLDGVVISGNGQLEAAIELGWTRIAVSTFEGTQDEAEAFAIADNQTALNSAWHIENLSEKLKELDGKFSPEDLGFYGDSILEILKSDKKKERDGKIGDPKDDSEIPDSEPGIYELGPHRLLCGDSSYVTSVQELMDGAQYDLLLTDPPYNVALEASVDGDIRKTKADLNSSAWDKGFKPSGHFEVISHFASPNASAYVFTSGFLFGEWFQFFDSTFESSAWCVFEKANPMPSLMKRNWTMSGELVMYATKYKHTFNFPKTGHAPNIWRFNSIVREKERFDHPTQKPLDVIEHPLKHSSKTGDIVLDLFGGTGTTLIACANMGRICRIAEMSPKFCDIIRRRWTSWALKNGEDPGTGALHEKG